MKTFDDRLNDLHIEVVSARSSIALVTTRQLQGLLTRLRRLDGEDTTYGGTPRLRSLIEQVEELIKGKRPRTAQRQEVRFIPEGRRLELAEKPWRVWTLMNETNEDPTIVPELPIEPRHNQNAFLEDQHHDWTWNAGVLRYFSRVALHSVWVLVEY